jgi:hypothetical protein
MLHRVSPQCTVLVASGIAAARQLPAATKTAPAPDYGGRASGPKKERAMLQPWAMAPHVAS